MSVDGAMRVSDAERGLVADRLARAHGEGRLTLAEYDERVRAAHGAVVRDDLAPLLEDLPGSGAPTTTAAAPDGRVAAAPVTGPAGRRRGACGPFGAFPVPPGLPFAPGGLRGAVAAWAVASAVNVVIWLAVVLGSGSLVYPWWIWVAGPWGLVLAAKALGRSAASRSATR
jgi:Domain of unknown function (DUF1707)